MNKFDLDKVMANLEREKKTLPKVIANQSVRYFKDSFNNQGWDGVKWKRLKKPRKGGSILVKSGRLRRSIKVNEATFNMIRIISDTPYSQIHNEGFKGIEKVKSHIRRDQKRDTFGIKKARTGKRSSRVYFGKTSAGISFVKSHTRKMDMPKRQFMGDSPNLTQKHLQTIEKAVEACFK